MRFGRFQRFSDLFRNSVKRDESILYGIQFTYVNFHMRIFEKELMCL